MILVLAGNKTHHKVNGGILCGCQDEVVVVYVVKLKKYSTNPKYPMPLCTKCVRINTERWEQMK